MDIQNIIVSHDHTRNHLNGVSTSITKAKLQQLLARMAVENRLY